MRDGESADQILCTATVLVEEAEAIRGHQIRTMDLKAIYRELNELDSVALCLSGGGIRSAAFSLGVVQALASTPCVAAPIGDSAKAPGSSAPPRKLLERFHYLSTVSGGGYLGSWLSTWLSRDDDHAMAHLTGRPNGPDEEPGELSWLRAYSNYLTPKLGLTSADAWADVALYLRNLVLNWIVFLPLLMVAALLLKLLLIASAAVGASETATYVAVAAGALGIVTATAATMRNRPTSGRNSLRQGAYLRVVLLPSLAAAALFSAAAGSGLARRTMGSLDRPSTIGWLAAAAALIYAIGWLVGRTGKGAADAASWVLAGAFYGAFAAFGAFAFLHLQHADVLHLGIHDAAAAALLLTILGPPWILLGQITGEMIFVGLTSHEENSDADREWLGRSAGWVTAAGCIWLVVTGLVLVGSDLALKSYGAAYGAVGGLSGALTAVIGLSKYTPAVGPAKTRAGISLNALLAIVATLFAAILVISCSALLDQLLLGHPLLQSRLLGGDVPDMPSAPQDLVWLLIGLVGALAVGYLASRTVNINRFSLHALYRNRLIRAFLGASNPTREQDANQFARFALSDNPPMTSLWPPKPPDGWAKLDRGRWRPFHVINMALNIVSTRRLAWQERKAESFTISPLHAGSACKAYRRTEHYGDPNGGLSVGTAVAISGAAVKPQHGLPLLSRYRLPGGATQRSARMVVGQPRPGRRCDLPHGGPRIRHLAAAFRDVRPHDGCEAVRLPVGRRPLREPRALRDGAPPMPVHSRRRRRLRQGLRVRGPRQCGSQGVARSRRRDRLRRHRQVASPFGRRNGRRAGSTLHRPRHHRLPCSGQSRQEGRDCLPQARLPRHRVSEHTQLRDGKWGLPAPEHGQPMVQRIAVRELP